jgi:hypothetical protein
VGGTGQPMVQDATGSSGEGRTPVAPFNSDKARAFHTGTRPTRYSWLCSDDMSERAETSATSQRPITSRPPTSARSARLRAFAKNIWTQRCAGYSRPARFAMRVTASRRRATRDWFKLSWTLDEGGHPKPRGPSRGVQGDHPSGGYKGGGRPPGGPMMPL